MDKHGFQALTLQDWLAIDQINDLLMSGGPTPENLKFALEIVLQALNRPGAVLFVINPQRGSILPLVQKNIPLHWYNQLEDSRSLLYKKAVDTIQRQITSSEIAIHLAGAIPVLASNHALGALLVYGAEIPAEDMPRWQAYMHSFGRILNAFHTIQNPFDRQKDLSALQAISQIQSMDIDIHATELLIVRNLVEIFNAEDALLIELDEEDPQLAIRKQLGSGEDWVNQVGLQIDHSQIMNILNKGEVFAEEEICSSLQYNPLIDSTLGLDIEKFICAPLATADIIAGVLFLINPGLNNKDMYRQQLLVTMTKSLANAMRHSRELLRLRIANADLEANRWEIINSRNTLRTMFDNLPSSVYIIDQNYVLIAINMHRSRRTEQPPNALVGGKCFERLYKRNDPCPGCRIQETFRTSHITTRIHREWVDQERSIEWEITTFPIQEKQNFPHQVIVFEEDVTEKRNLEANLIQSEKLAAVGQLAAGVAHEINNPLAAIIANAQLMRREIPAGYPDLIDSLQLIETAGLRAAQVVSNLLGLSRKEKKYEFESLSLNDSIKSALSLVQHELVNRSVRVQLDLQENIPDLIASKNHLQGVWINLIINGIDAINHSDGQISISTRYSDQEFRITIADNGHGIPKEQLTRIFEPFFTTKIAGRGTGLGLSVCMRIIKEHHGNIQVDSQPGQGTKFSITLPELHKSGNIY